MARTSGRFVCRCHVGFLWSYVCFVLLRFRLYAFVKAAALRSTVLRYELYDLPKASLLPLKARMVRSEVVEALLYGCVTWTPLKCHYAKLRTTHHRMLLRILGAWCKSPNKRILSYKDALHRTQCESIETTVRTRRLLWAGALLRMGDHRLPKRVMSGELENAGKRGVFCYSCSHLFVVCVFVFFFALIGAW